MSQELYRGKILPIRSKLQYIAYTMLGDEEDAEDAVQEILLRLWSNLQALETYDNPAAFATTMLKNYCLDKIRLGKTKESLEIIANLEYSTENPYVLLERKNTETILKEIISRLPELQRIILQMKDIEDYNIEEIAEITGSKIEAIRMNLSRARKRVRAEFVNYSKERSNLL